MKLGPDSLARLATATKRVELERCMGIRVYYDPRMPLFAESRGIGPWKEIVIGPSLLGFPPREQQAVLIHEVGHCKLRHLERRLLWALVLIFWPPALARFCRMQELQADRFAAGCGYGADLARWMGRLRAAPNPMHPPLAERITRLTA